MARSGDVTLAGKPFSGGKTGMTTSKRAIRQGPIRLGPIWVVCLMLLWGLAMIAPAALPH